MQKAIPLSYGLRLYLLTVPRVRRATCAPLRAVVPPRSATALFPAALLIPDLTRTARRGHGDRETNGAHRHLGPCDPRARNDSHLRATCANRAEVWLTDSECHAHIWTSPPSRPNGRIAVTRMGVPPRGTQAVPPRSRRCAVSVATAPQGLSVVVSSSPSSTSQRMRSGKLTSLGEGGAPVDRFDLPEV